jgi:hypothetical protein
MSVMFLLTLGSALLAQGSPPAKKSDKYVSEKGKFAVKFTGKVRTAEQQSDTAYGKITTHVTSAQVEQNVTFLVVYSEVPASARSDTAALLDNIKASSKGLDGVIARDEALSFGPDKLPGRKIIVRKESSILRSMIILKNDRVYQVIIISQGGMFGDPRAEEFFSSFEFTK